MVFYAVSAIFQPYNGCLAQWFLQRRYLSMVNVFSLFRYYRPPEKGMALHLKKLKAPSVEIGPDVRVEDF